MRTFRYIVAATFFALSSGPAQSQTIKLFNVAEIISRADALYDSGKYAEAITTLKTIPERDTAYAQSLTKLAYAYIDSKEYDKAIEVCQNALKIPSDGRANLLRIQALATSRKGDVEQAASMLEDAIKEYPTDVNLISNLGLVQYNKKEYVKAEQTFFKLLGINPFYQTAHLNLARLAIGQGRKVHAMLAMGIYLGVNEKDNAHLVLLNNFVDNQVEEEGSIAEFGTNAPSKLDRMIRAKIVNEQGFKSIFNTKAPVIQQFELLFDQINTIPSNTDDRYAEFYVPIYKAIKEGNSIEAFVYHLLSSSSIEDAAKWRSRNEKTLATFYDITNVSLRKHRENVAVQQLGVNEPVNAWYFGSNQLQALGNMTGEKRIGKWIFFHINSERQAEGQYNDLGKKVGTWKYYHNNGKVKSIENYDTGDVTVYSKDGNKTEHFFLKGEKIDGDVELFYEEGPVKEKLKFSAGKREGKRDLFFPNGTLRASYQYKGGEPNGSYIINHENGRISERCSYMNDNLHGKYESFYVTGTVLATGEYTEGNKTGLWKNYFSNGQLKSTGSYNEKGAPTGEWTYYDNGGLLSEKRNFDSEGRFQGDITYYDGGQLFCTSTYKKDILLKDTYYDRNGKVISSSGSSDGTFYSKNYFSTGELRSEGNNKKGKAEGPWKVYNRFGVLVGEYLYKDNSFHGPAKDYYPSGELKREAEYKEGELHGYVREYYRNGKVKLEGWYQDGNREQQWLAYYPDGTIESDYYYLQNRNVGKGYQYSVDEKKYCEIETDFNGNIVDIRYFNSQGTLSSRRRKENFSDIYEDFTKKNKLRLRLEILCGNYSGALETFSPDGTLVYRYEFLDGEKNGRYLYNELSGEASISGMYADNERTGHWKRYHENGKLVSEGIYRDDLRDSLWTFYYDNGNVSSRGWFNDDKRHGLSTFYGPDGKPVLEKRYKYGSVIAYRPLTNINDSTWIPFSGNGKIEISYANGNKALLEEYKNGLLDGSDRQYYPDGKIYSETIYSGGDLTGEYKAYHPNNKLKERGAYEDDSRNGIFERYAEDGTLEAMETYRLGYRNGKSVLYKKGVKQKEVNFWYGAVED